MQSKSYLARLYAKRHLSARQIARLTRTNRQVVFSALRRCSIPKNGRNRTHPGQLPFGYDYQNYRLVKNRVEQKRDPAEFGGGEILPEVSRFFDLLQQHYVPRIGSPPVLSDEQLKRIACPVLMMTGGEDAFFNAQKAGARLKKVLPGSEILIEVSGEHGITEYGGRIARFLRGVLR